MEPQPICYRSVISACEQSSNWEVALCLLAFHEDGCQMALPCSAGAASSIMSSWEYPGVPCDGYCSPGPDRNINVQVKNRMFSDVSRTSLYEPCQGDVMGYSAAISATAKAGCDAGIVQTQQAFALLHASVTHRHCCPGPMERPSSG